MPRLHGDYGNNINFALRCLADLSVLCPFKGVDPAVCAGGQGWWGGSTAFAPWNLCFGQGHLAGEEGRGGEKSVKGEREETKAEVWRKRLHRIHGEAEKTGGKDEVGKHGYTEKRSVECSRR